jgi:hypothetical protein
LRASIRDDFSRDAVESEDLAVMEVRDTLGINVGRGGEYMDLFTIMINIDDNSIVPSNTG